MVYINRISMWKTSEPLSKTTDKKLFSTLIKDLIINVKNIKYLKDNLEE